jgi:hypothetical protein
VEENIYEEIGDARGAFENPYNFSLEERRGGAPLPVSEEVRQVQRGHQRVLGQLDLAMEALIMPGDPLPEEDPDDEVGPTDELLTPDSGFHSGSGYAVGWRSNVAASLPPPRKDSPPPPAHNTHRRSRSLRQELGLFAKKGWKMAGLSKIGVASSEYMRSTLSFLYIRYFRWCVFVSLIAHQHSNRITCLLFDTFVERMNFTVLQNFF